MFSKYDNIVSSLKISQKETRFEHTLGVACTACSLAMCYKEDFEKAYLAGLLHDCSKTKDADYILMAKEYGMEIPDYAYNSPALLHAPLSALMAKDVYNIDDEEVLKAISSHNFGHPDMSLLEKILYVADYIEPNRNFDPEKLNCYRCLAFEDIDKCLYYILQDTIEFVKNNGYTLVPISYDTYLFYENKNKES